MGARWGLPSKAEQGKERQKSLSHGKQMLSNATARACARGGLVQCTAYQPGSPWLKQREKTSSQHRAPPGTQIIWPSIWRNKTPQSNTDLRACQEPRAARCESLVLPGLVDEDTIAWLAALRRPLLPPGHTLFSHLSSLQPEPRSTHLGETVCMTWLLDTNLGRGWGCCGMEWAAQFPVLRSDRILGPREDGSAGVVLSVPPAYQARRPGHVAWCASRASSLSPLVPACLACLVLSRFLLLFHPPPWGLNGRG